MPKPPSRLESDVLPPPARPSRWGAMLRLGIGVVFATWSLLLLAWVLLYWAILPNARAWLPQIEQQASSALGAPLTIGDIRVRTGGWLPVVELSDVVLHDDRQREVLRLARVSAAISPRSLVALELRMRQLHVEGAQIELRRERSGVVRVAGFAMQGRAGDDGALARWFFRQGEFVLRQARLRWVDELRAAPPLDLADVELVVRNGLRSRQVRLDATPPVAWGDRFSLRARLVAPLLGGGADWRHFGGTVYGELPRVDLAALRQHVSLPFELHAGHGALRTWIELVQGEPVATTADVALEEVALRVSPSVQPLELRRLQGRLGVRRDADALALTLEHFAFDDDEGRHWPPGGVQLTLRQRAGADDTRTLEGGEFRADRLDLAQLAWLARRLPLADETHRWLDELQPVGVIEPVQARWDGPLDAPRHYRVQATLSDFAIAAGEVQPAHHVGRPGWHGARIELDADERGGRASLAIDGGALVLPGVFERPEVALERFGAALRWSVGRNAEGAARLVELAVDDARFANDDARGEFSARWRSGIPTAPGEASDPGALDLRGRIVEGRADAVARYLPLGIPESTRGYVAHAVRGGRIDDARFRVEGPLRDFPFVREGSGTFRIQGRAREVTFAYVPDHEGWTSPWPALTAVSGDLDFDRVSMAVRNGVARFYGVEMSGVSATIPDMVHDPVLQIDGRAQGPANDLLRFVAASPVGGWLGGALAPASIDGRGGLDLSIRVPLTAAERSTVRGVLALAGNDVRLAPELPLLAGTRGRVEFSDQGFRLQDMQASVFGGDTRLEGGLRPDGRLEIDARGRVDVAALRAQTMAAGAARRIVERVSGATDYRLRLEWQHHEPLRLELESDLVGVALDLPPPLAKRADVALPLRLRSAPAGAADDAPQRWTLALGADVQAQFLRALDERGQVQVAGGIGVGEPAPSPSSGVAALVTLPALDVDAWRLLLGGGGAAAGSAPPGTATTGTAAYLPTRIGLRVAELRVEGRRLTGVVAGVSREAASGRWRATAQATQFAGYLEWRPGADDAAPGGVYARLARMSLPPATGTEVEQLLERAAPQQVPALDIVVDDFEVGGRHLGRFEVEAQNRALVEAGSGRHEWRLEGLRLVNDDARLVASGRWQPAHGAERARMQGEFRLDVADAGALLARLGMPGVLRGGSGALRGDLSWQGSPLAPHAPTMDGRLVVAMGAGQFLKADSRAARLLSVLSLQALPRRLTLDFRDVFEQGFEFDDITGDVTIAEGIARTNNLRMRGLQAGVLMEGQADLVHETQDLRVLVVPEIDAATVSLLYSIINPVVGMGTFVAQMFLRQPLMQASTREFHVHGTWADPQVDRVQRTALAPATPAEAGTAQNPGQ